VFSSQLSPVPWLDVNASLGVRDTYYSKSQRGDLGCDGLPNTGDFGEGNGVVDAERDQNQNGIFDPAEDLGCDNLPGPSDFGEGNGVWDHEDTVITDQSFDRRIYQGGLTVIGPKLSRVYDRPGSKFSPQYKNTIEPQISYTYLSRVTDPDRVIPFDQIDAIGGNANLATYAIVTRLFAKRPIGGMEQMNSLFGPANSTFVGGGRIDPYAKTRELLQRKQQEQQQAGGASQESKAEEEKRRLSTVEIASLEISQDYSFLGPLSASSALGSAFAPLQSNFGPIQATLRVNPSLHTSVDMRSSYDILFRQIREASLSANLRSLKRGFLDVTWSSIRDLESRALFAQGLGFQQPFNRSQIGLQGETSFWGRKLLLGMQTNYELGDIQAGEPRLRDQRYRFGYNTQCCGFQLEVLNRNFVGSSQREFRFLINLKGVGNVIDFQSGSAGALPGTFPGIVP